MKYGYIDEVGQLISRNLEEVTNTIVVDGENVDVLVTIEAQLEALGTAWKPVDDVDPEQLSTDDEEYYIDIAPYDDGKRIKYRYTRKLCVSVLHDKVEQLKQQLHDEDYKIVKSYECSLLGEPLPYNVQELHARRNEIREQINELRTRIEQAQ